MIRDELEAVAAAGLTDDEVERGKGMLKGATVLGLEETGSRMSRIGKGELMYGDILEIDELLARIDAVSVDDVRSIASELLARPMSLGVIGPFDPRLLRGGGVMTQAVPGDGHGGGRAAAAPVRVGVLGARGRMGSEVCRAIDAADDLDLVAMVDAGDWLFNVSDAGAQVVVDFTTPDVVMDNIRWCIDQGISTVVGTTGFDAERLATVREWLAAASTEVGCRHRTELRLGGVLMMQFAEKAARYFESVEIIEMHHPNKIDAPSGTARRTAEMIAGTRASAGRGSMPDATTSEFDNARGAQVEGVPVHSVRMAGLVAHQEVICGTAGETLTIRHDSFDRASFMPGVLLAVRAVLSSPGLTIGLDPFLEG